MSAPPPPVPPSMPVPPASPPAQSFDEIIRQRQAEAAQARLSGQFQQGQVRSPSLRTTPIRPPSVQMSTRPLSTPAYVPPPNYYGSSSAVGGQGCDQSCNQGNCDEGCDMDMKTQLMDCEHMDMNEGGHEDALAIQRTPMRIIAAITMAVAVVELGIGKFNCFFLNIMNPPLYAFIISRTPSSLSLISIYNYVVF